jgi:hypothetical protein
MMNRLLAALVCVLPASAVGDAAVKAREGEIRHWIEYYQRERQPPAERRKEAPVAQPAPAATDAEGKESKR